MMIKFEFDDDIDDAFRIEQYVCAEKTARALNKIVSFVLDMWDGHNATDYVKVDILKDKITNILQEENINMEEMGY